MIDSLETMLGEQRMARLKAGTQRTLVETATDGVYALQEGRRYLSFSSNDYLGLRDVLVSRVAGMAGSSASPAVTGYHGGYRQLERLTAEMKHTQAALVFGSGYLANIGAVAALAAPEDLVLMDRLSHACMIDGVRLSGAAYLRYRHNDMAHLERLLKRHRASHRHCLVLTETVFSMDGDRAPLDEIRALCTAHDAWMLTDDAHGFGLPPSVPSPADVQVGTFSKAAGSYGGYVAASAAVIDHLANRARPFLFSTALPPCVIQASADALRLMQAEPERGERVMRHASRISDALGLPPAQSAIVPVIIGANAQTLAVQARLKERGILVAAIRPPTVAQGSARLRISLSAAHTDEQIGSLIAALHAVR